MFESLFAHNDRVTDVRFVPDTHYFFSAGRDGTIKYWDGDKFEKILTLNGHNQQVWGLRLSKSGRQLASCGSDMSVRVWEETDEQLVLEEEQQKELETMYDRELNQVNESKPTAVVGSGLPEQQENARATTSNLATRDAGERVKIIRIEYFDFIFALRLRWHWKWCRMSGSESVSGKHSPIFLKRSARSLSRIRSSLAESLWITCSRQ